MVGMSQPLDKLCDRHGLLAIYLFGSRADDGLRILAGDKQDRAGADLDVGVVHSRLPDDPLALGGLQVELEDIFAPLRVDVVPLRQVDAIFQFNALSGHRIAARDSTRADEYELEIMRQASELVAIQRRNEIDLYGFSST